MYGARDVHVRRRTSGSCSPHLPWAPQAVAAAGTAAARPHGFSGCRTRGRGFSSAARPAYERRAAGWLAARCRQPARSSGRCSSSSCRCRRLPLPLAPRRRAPTASPGAASGREPRADAVVAFAPALAPAALAPAALAAALAAASKPASAFSSAALTTPSVAATAKSASSLAAAAQPSAAIPTTTLAAAALAAASEPSASKSASALPAAAQPAATVPAAPKPATPVASALLTPGSQAPDGLGAVEHGQLDYRENRSART